MLSWLAIVVVVFASLLLVPMAILALEVVAACLPARRQPAGRGPGARCVVLVCAHNEEESLPAALGSITPNLAPGDRLVVVADNCTDATAQVARQAGAEVVERNSQEGLGKSYALEFGMRWLDKDPPDVVVIIDADCHLQPGALDVLVGEAMRTGRPLQATYLHDAPPGAGMRDQLSSFAVRFKNLVRPRGLERLGIPCLLNGAGATLPWHAMHGISCANTNMAEDYQLAIDLACAGHFPKFCEQARVDTVLPAGGKAAYRQRKRWEHGHLYTVLTQVPRLTWTALRRGQLGLLGLAADTSVPPLSILVILYLVTSILWVLAPTWTGGLLLALGAILGVGALLLAWATFGRQVLPLGSLLAAPLYALGKLPLYLAFLFKPQRAWLRTQRSTAPGAETAGPEAR